ncbi:hypothetical protein [Desulfosporosinus nitroreducens]|uniref:hypothetical protein n=1 Tax=Desulfosporosinus nitroreducens TaxID=2018668 RepID=UPI00207C3857|nr:hypothetical protein [Desulfosporosinus nitroreducens]MCO1601996.1 hypothetical protein [Desulfosporosinus nitroreducens]
MNTYIENYIHEEILKKYQHDKEMMEKSISAYELCILDKFKREHPLRLFSIYYLNRFRKKWRQLVLLPSIDEYEKINIKDELFDANVLFPIRIGKQDYALQI